MCLRQNLGHGRSVEGLAYRACLRDYGHEIDFNIGRGGNVAIKEGWRERFFEDFEVGDIYEHPFGRTVTTTDNLWFTLLT